MNNFNQETSDTGSDKKWAMNKLMNEVIITGVAWVAFYYWITFCYFVIVEERFSIRECIFYSAITYFSIENFEKVLTTPIPPLTVKQIPPALYWVLNQSVKNSTRIVKAFTRLLLAAKSPYMRSLPNSLISFIKLDQATRQFDWCDCKKKAVKYEYLHTKNAHKDMPWFVDEWPYLPTVSFFFLLDWCFYIYWGSARNNAICTLTEISWAMLVIKDVRNVSKKNLFYPFCKNNLVWIAQCTMGYLYFILRIIYWLKHPSLLTFNKDWQCISQLSISTKERKFNVLKILFKTDTQLQNTERYPQSLQTLM